jgi:hypothetical protein
MFSLVDLLIVVLYMLKALVILAGAGAGLLASSRVAILLYRISPWPLERHRR